MPNCCFCYQPVPAEEGAYHRQCCQRFFGIGHIPALDLDTHGLQEVALQTAKQQIALTGVQPKLSAQLTPEKARLTLVGLWGEYILKPQSSLYPQMPECEDLTMHLAKLMGISTCDHALIPTTQGEWVYIARRFDRSPTGAIHVEDLCQLSNLPTERKYKSSHEKVGKLILKHCTNKGLDALAYFERVVFSFMTGNNDMHLKNFSLVHGAGTIYLSPAYDLLNVRILHPEDTEELALTLNGKKNRLKWDDFRSLATQLQISPKVVERLLASYAAQEAAVQALIARSFLSAPLQAAYHACWAANFQQLKEM
jgi:serine/threonine-protein kinase HipA